MAYICSGCRPWHSPGKFVFDQAKMRQHTSNFDEWGFADVSNVFSVEHIPHAHF